MRYEFKLPDIGEGLTEGVIREWLVKVGDTIQEDAPLCEIETDKVTVEITAPCTGTLVSMTGVPGETLQVGTVIAAFETEQPPLGAQESSQGKIHEAPAESTSSETVEAIVGEQTPVKTGNAPTSAPSPIGSNVRATPATRRLAREQGVDLNIVAGSGPSARILQSDILQHADAAAGPAPDSAFASVNQRFAVKSIPNVPGETRVKPTTLQAAVAEQMVRSVTMIPHASSSYRCEAEQFVTLRKLLQERLATRISFTAMVMKAMVPALQQFPKFNCSFDDTTNEIVYPPSINIGFATYTDDGLVVPVVRDCAGKNLAEISAEIDRLADAARNRKITAADLRGGTTTLSNVGSHGRIETTGGRLIVNHPQAAIIGLSRIRPQPVVRSGEVVATRCIDIYTSYDHRIIDGIYANLFIEQLAGVIEEPGMMLAV